MKLIFDWRDENGEQDDEACAIYLDDDPRVVEIATVNHDEHGWDGMRAVIYAMKTTARACDWEIVINGQEGI